VHAEEGRDPKALQKIAHDRAYKHGQNALALVQGRETLQRFAGKGLRQGKDHEGSLEEERS